MLQILALSRLLFNDSRFIETTWIKYFATGLNLTKRLVAACQFLAPFESGGGGATPAHPDPDATAQKYRDSIFVTLHDFQSDEDSVFIEASRGQSRRLGGGHTVVILILYSHQSIEYYRQ